MDDCLVVVGTGIAHFAIGVVVVVHSELEERDRCSLVEGSPVMVVVAEGTLARLMVEEEMLFIDVRTVEIVGKTFV